MFLRLLFAGLAVALWHDAVAAVVDPSSPPPLPIVLPRDDGVLLTSVQWWYWTGHLALQADPSKKYGFELCFFIVGDMVDLVQVAVTDVSRQKFVYTEELDLKNNLKNSSKGSFDLTSRSGKMVAVGGDGKDNMSFSVGEYSVSLDLQSLKPPAIHYGGLPHSYSFGGYTYYYSRTNMNVVKGTINDEPATGTAWFDRQWGNLAKAVLQGWQWFALELDGDVQVMLFDFLADDSEKYGSITQQSGTTVDMAAGDFTVEILGNWTSPRSKCTYPSGWKIDIRSPSLTTSLVVTPSVLDQELKVADSPTYWEGKCDVVSSSPGSGAEQRQGQAYVELNGYCPKF